MIQIRLIKEQNMRGYSLIEAFPGAGLVGPMAGSYLIEKLKMEYIGHIESDFFPPIAAIHNSVPMFPARIYKNDKYKFVLFISEFTIPSNLISQLTAEILAFVRKNYIARIISVGAMPSQKPTDKIYLTSTDQSMLKRALKIGIKPIAEGVVAGVSAVLLVNAAEYKIPTFDILVEVDPTIMDPKYAELAIKGLNQMLDIDIDLSELDKEAKAVEAKIRDLLKKVKDSHEHYAQTEESTGTGPSMYA